LLALRVEEDGAVGAGGLRDRIALHVGRPGAAVRVVLERIEVARLSPEFERNPRHLAGRSGMVRGELASLFRLLEAAPACGEHDGGRLELFVAREGAPAVLDRLEASERAVREGLPGARFPGLAQRLRDRVPRAVADLEQSLAGRAAAARQPVAAV